MKIKDNINSRVLENSSFWTVSSMPNQEQTNLLKGNEINKDQCRLIPLIDEALMIFKKREKEQEILFFMLYSIVVLFIIFEAIL